MHPIFLSQIYRYFPILSSRPVGEALSNQRAYLSLKPTQILKNMHSPLFTSMIVMTQLRSKGNILTMLFIFFEKALLEM
jgi:hypothetical protein